MTPGKVAAKDPGVKIMAQFEELKREHEEMTLANQRLRRQVSELKQIGRIVRSVTSSLTIEEILTNLLNGIKKTLELERVVLCLVNAARGREEAKLALGIEGHRIEEACWPIEEESPLWARLQEEGRPVLVESTSQDLPDVLRGIFPGAFLKTPMMVKGQIVGTILCNRSEREIEEKERDLLREFSEYGAIAIQNGRLYYDVLKSEEELKKAHQKLIEAEKMALVGQMAISINHEINNPLCNISLIAQTISEQMCACRPELMGLLSNVEENVGRIQQVTRKISKLTSTSLTEYLPNQMMVDLQ